MCAAHMIQRLPVETNMGPVSGSLISSLLVLRCIRTCAARSWPGAVIVSVAIFLNPAGNRLGYLTFLIRVLLRYFYLDFSYPPTEPQS